MDAGLNDRRVLVRMSLAAYGLILAVTCVIAWAAGVDLAAQLNVTLGSVGLGLVAVPPMLLAFLIPGDLKDRVTDLIGRALSQCRWWDLLLLATLAGVVEELLFRGVLQVLGDRVAPFAGLIGANLLFGMVHPLTWMYFVVATIFGVYFSLLADWQQPRNLVSPIVAHLVYDLLGFVYIARAYRQEQSDTTEPEMTAEPAPEATTV